MIEAYGTGLTKIMEAYEGTSEKPVISTTKNSFKIILPNINEKYETQTAIENTLSMPVSESDNNVQRVLDYIREHGSITRPETEELLGISASTASRLIRKMVKTGLLLQNGRARNSRYILAG